METQLAELRRLAAHAKNRRTETGIPRVAMVQGAIPEHELAAVYDPMVNLILRGSKSMTIGERTLHYDPATYFVMSIDLPAVGTIHPAPTGEPYLAVSLTIDPQVVGAMLADAGAPVSAPSSGSFSVASVTPELLDAWVRMLRLIERPAEIPVLAPAYEREILYRVLQGPHGAMLRDIAMPDTALSRIRLAIQWIRNNFTSPLRVEALAEIAAMSASAFHRHFKAATAMSPLQFQKRIRLMQARMLLIAGAQSAASVAFDVGYESASQFSREYARFFGMPPARDALVVQRELGRAVCS
ncbi:AraC family transcriptional regulator [Sphingomonas sp. SRS2]|uniref:AraC family transcriptional regulator n=1 Tax=Sphingomonas sp. SRS2 TaxID=133190 RepID=UPI000618460E|nr:AraC family transcriptional regulator [Sphingomonas sp. SRS2]KKC27920.1 AraC family transcriptional regulator [Sphingomonas sp. SRS2]